MRELSRYCERRGGLCVYIDDLVFIALVVLAVALAVVIANVVLKRVARAAQARRLDLDAEQRAKTFFSVFRGVVVTALVLFGFIAVLRWYKVNLTPFLASAGVIGVILALAAQSFIKDILAGFFILLEDQFAVGDVVETCGVSGDVEAMTLRTTTLRDLNGCAHIIPNGDIRVVTNYTRGWSRVDLKVAVSRDEDADRVIAVLDDELAKLRADGTYGPLLDGAPRVLGVDAFDDASFTVRLLIKTKPGEQWRTRREFRRRVKGRFDAEGIAAPYAYRVETRAGRA